MLYDILIIGGGIAGMTSALYAKRNNKNVLIIEKEAFGGQIASSPKVENFPTIQSISGLELSDRIFTQITEYGVDFELDTVVSLKKENDVFTVTTVYGEYQSKTVVIASGVKHKTLRIPGEEDLVGKGISYCAVCDGPFYKGEEVVLVGDGNTALQYALLLSEYCSKVKVCTLFDRFFGDESHVTALMKKDNVEVIQNVATVAFEKDNSGLTGVVFENRIDKSRFTIATKALFVAIGQIPDNEIYSDLADLDKYGYILSDENCTTKTEGLFVAGDCRVKAVRQLTTAAADGAVAALNACNYILKHVDLWK